MSTKKNERRYCENICEVHHNSTRRKRQNAFLIPKPITLHIFSTPNSISLAPRLAAKIIIIFHCPTCHNTSLQLQKTSETSASTSMSSSLALRRQNFQHIFALTTNLAQIETLYIRVYYSTPLSMQNWSTHSIDRLFSSWSNNEYCYKYLYWN